MIDVQALEEIPPWEWPGGASEIIWKTLVDRQAEAAERLVAADLASELVVMNDKLAGGLLGIVQSSDEPEPLRAQAAISLGPVLEEAYMSDIGDSDDGPLIDADKADAALWDDLNHVPISKGVCHNIRDTLRKLYLDESLPAEIRRRVLEGSIRFPQDWHPGAIAAAYSNGNKDWVLTAVFAMRWVRGFENQILESLDNADPEIRCEAVCAAGTWELDAAWPHVVALLKNPATPKPLLLAAIEAVASIRPEDAGVELVDLSDSQDPEIREAALEGMSTAETLSGGDLEEADEEDEEDDEDDEEDSETDGDDEEDDDYDDDEDEEDNASDWIH
jgi:hypothetical protein